MIGPTSARLHLEHRLQLLCTSVVWTGAEHIGPSNNGHKEIFDPDWKEEELVEAVIDKIYCKDCDLYLTEWGQG